MVKKLFIALTLFTPIACLQAADNNLATSPLAPASPGLMQPLDYDDNTPPTPEGAAHYYAQIARTRRTARSLLPAFDRCYSEKAARTLQFDDE